MLRSESIAASGTKTLTPVASLISIVVSGEDVESTHRNAGIGIAGLTALAVGLVTANFRFH